MRHNRSRPNKVFIKKKPWYKRLGGWIKSGFWKIYSAYNIYRNVKKIL